MPGQLAIPSDERWRRFAKFKNGNGNGNGNGKADLDETLEPGRCLARRWPARILNWNVRAVHFGSCISPEFVDGRRE